MFRKFVVPAVLGLAVLGFAAESAQAQLRARVATLRERLQERRGMRRVVVPRTTKVAPAMTYTYQGDGYTTQSLSYYFSPATRQPALTVAAPANVRIILPSANAKVLFDGAPTQQTGLDRMFATPVLQPGTHNYTIRATYMLNGREVTHERRINVTPGRTTVLDLTRR